MDNTLQVALVTLQNHNLIHRLWLHCFAQLCTCSDQVRSSCMVKFRYWNDRPILNHSALIFTVVRGA